ncbi:MAG: hypothetical protein K6G24_01895 [Lachnospiraceae bacterium]|nr:hypothetical protein [Lachnospiraceae bacterium]
MKNAFVRVKEQDERLRIISFLEDNGYKIDKTEPRSPKDIIEDFLPIVINPGDKSYRMMGNVTCAAAAASGDALIAKEEFYKQFEDIKIVNPKEEEDMT